jgi:hypothetical protein
MNNEFPSFKSVIKHGPFFVVLFSFVLKKEEDVGLDYVLGISKVCHCVIRLESIPKL